MALLKFKQYLEEAEKMKLKKGEDYEDDESEIEDDEDEADESKKKKMHKEELKGNQHKLDKNKNGKIDSHDFKLLKKGK